MLGAMQLCTRRAMLQTILHGLNLPYEKLGEGELRLSLIDYLQSEQLRGEGLLLLVDEAQGLPHKLLEELRQLSNVALQGTPRVRLVLAGSPTFEERLGNAGLEAFQQRLTTRCYLLPFTFHATEQYIGTQLAASGVTDSDFIDDDVFEYIHRTTDGIPRIINQLCDHSLLLGMAAEQKRLTLATFEEAWCDLQQIPSPKACEISVASSSDASVIEFGELDDIETDSTLEEIAVPWDSKCESENTQGYQEVGNTVKFEEIDSNDLEEPADVLEFPTLAQEEIGAIEEIDIEEAPTLSFETQKPEAAFNKDQEQAKEEAALEDSEVTAQIAAIQERLALLDVEQALVAKEDEAERLNAEVKVEVKEVSQGSAEQVETETTNEPSSSNPFGNSFEEEEVVVDQYVRTQNREEEIAPEMLTLEEQVGFLTGAASHALHSNTTGDFTPCNIPSDTNEAMKSCKQEADEPSTEFPEDFIEEELLGSMPLLVRNNQESSAMPEQSLNETFDSIIPEDDLELEPVLAERTVEPLVAEVTHNAPQQQNSEENKGNTKEKPASVKKRAAGLNFNRLFSSLKNK